MVNKSTTNLFYQWHTEPSCIDIRNERKLHMDNRTSMGEVSPHDSLGVS